MSHPVTAPLKKGCQDPQRTLRCFDTEERGARRVSRGFITCGGRHGHADRSDAKGKNEN